MKKIIALILALVLILAVAAPAFAAGTFVPSISYKDGPEIEDAEMNGENVGDCIVITSIQQAKDKSTDIYQEDRDLLLEVYEKLNSGEMKLPIEEDHVIRELLDVSFKVNPCVENDEHIHREELLKSGVTMVITFDLGVAKDANVIVMSYYEGAWERIASVTNNGDGTVTCVFEHFCPVAFAVEEEKVDGPAQTGDILGQNLMLWIVLMVVSMAAIVALNGYRRKQA
jgi:cytochrome c-type biogenesis protein CcmH/NrfF